MSANEGAITARKPKSASAHTACSRELPQPKLARATRILELLEALIVEHELAIGLIAPIVKESFGEPAAHHRLQKLLGDDLVGIDVFAVERSDETGEILECVAWQSVSCSLRWPSG